MIIKSIFSPNQYQLERTMTSIGSLLQLQINIPITFIGFTIYPEVLKQKYPTQKFIFLSQNYGKTYILNYMIKNNHTFSSNAIYYFDHDILFPDSVIFAPIIQSTLSNTFSLIAFNQKEDNRHQLLAFQNMEHAHNLTIYYPNSNLISSIALGAFVISKECLRDLVELELEYVYGADDYRFLQEIQNNNHRSGILKDYYVVHPFDKDEEYLEWKKTNILKTLDQKMNNKKINYQDSIQESHQFWELPFDQNKTASSTS